MMQNQYIIKQNELIMNRLNKQNQIIEMLVNALATDKKCDF